MENKVNVDWIIRNGRVIDPTRNIDNIETIGINRGQIVEFPARCDVDSTNELDAQGCLVIPGMIDFHTHFNARASITGVNPDLAYIPAGVTTAVDQGSTGYSNCRAFLDTSVHYSIKTKFYLHVSPIGQPFAAHNPEPYIPEKWDRESYVRAIEYGNGRIIGLKLRLQKDVIGTISGERLLKESVKLATDLKMPLSIHITDPALPISEVVQYLRPGDVLTHIFHGRGYTIFENNKIPEPIMAARKRGVIYDVGHGGVNFSATIARKAVEQGFLPDMISTDNTLYGWLKPDLYSLPNVMSMFLSFGMEVRDIVRCVTAKPANVVGMENKIGTLAPGASGDVTILKIRERPVKFTNSFGETHSGNAIFVPQAVLINGELLYRPEDSAVERSAAQYFKI